MIIWTYALGRVLLVLCLFSIFYLMQLLHHLEHYHLITKSRLKKMRFYVIFIWWICKLVRFKIVSEVLVLNESIIDLIPCSLIPFSIQMIWKKCDEGKVICWWFVFVFVLCLLSKLSSVSDRFPFNASLNDVAPWVPIPFPVVILKKRIKLRYYNLLFLPLHLHIRLSFINVLLFFNDSLKDVAPICPMSLSIIWCWKESQMWRDITCRFFVLTPQRKCFEWHVCF